MNTSDQPPTKGFAILIKAPGAKRTFVPREGETITITDKSGKELWTFKVPVPIDNPGVILYDVQIDLLTERDFSHFCQKTWTCPPKLSEGGSPSHATPPTTPPPPTTNPS